LNDKERLAAAIREFFARPMTMGELQELVADIFGPDRAEEIAVTEVTRASAMKRKAEADELRAAGFEIIEIWHTCNDSLVCADCQHEGKARGDGWDEYPPVHAGCRCSVAHQIA
jgi:hypothetical protein